MNVLQREDWQIQEKIQVGEEEGGVTSSSHANWSIFEKLDQIMEILKRSENVSKVQSFELTRTMDLLVSRLNIFASEKRPQLMIAKGVDKDELEIKKLLWMEYFFAELSEVLKWEYFSTSLVPVLKIPKVQFQVVAVKDEVGELQAVDEGTKRAREKMHEKREVKQSKTGSTTE
eukprot:Gb_32268 [translate_table: standard]